MIRKIFLAGALVLHCATVASADEKQKENHEKSASGIARFVHGEPDDPTAVWALGAGGRIYDTWWDALGRSRPRETNPAYPSTGKRTGSNTWRCVECHGWDYKGKDGVNGKDGPLAERYTGIKGIRDARKLSVDRISQMMRAAPHNYTPEMIDDQQLKRLAAFIRSGQHDTDRYIDAKTGKAKGDVKRGAAVFQTICAACHGLDGRALNWGSAQEPGFIGTEASKLPWEVLHKIRNAHPGAAMVTMRAMPFSDSVDVLTYAQTLPKK